MLDQVLTEENHPKPTRLRSLLGLGFLILLASVYFYFLYNALTDQIKF